MAILDALGASDGMTINQLEEAVNLRQGQIEQALKFLSVDSPAPVMKEGSRWQRTPVAYSMDHDRIRRLTEQREVEWQEVQDYIDEQGCLMQFLGNALDDDYSQPCGICASCLGRPIVEPIFSRSRAVESGRFLRCSETPLECKRQVAKDAFLEYGFRGNLAKDLRAGTGRILSRWGDAGWGRVVAEDKHNNHFRAQLVDAVADMVSERWHPKPAPEWVTCVPSRNHPELVPDFARRLAERLGLPFVSAVRKVRDNEPQKAQQNRFHQCRNLDGVFTVEQPIPEGAVLLVDDVFDSGWRP
jgi:ATP-dependent DNA helicase RecQ